MNTGLPEIVDAFFWLKTRGRVTAVHEFCPQESSVRGLMRAAKARTRLVGRTEGMNHVRPRRVCGLNTKQGCSLATPTCVWKLQEPSIQCGARMVRQDTSR